MKYAISIDWLSFFCLTDDSPWHPVEDDPNAANVFGSLPWVYKKEPHGTRQYKELWRVILQGNEVAEVQCCPCSSILPPLSCIVKFNNRLLYQHDLWEIVDRFIRDHEMTIQNISRLDICADFLRFECSPCIKFIADFLGSKIRRVGRGKGGAYFQHYTSKNVDGCSISHLDYTGLSFGDKKSDSRVYMYNKSLELQQIKNKPYIKDFWRRVGLIETYAGKDGKVRTRDVWRLEVSMGNKAMKFKDRNTDEVIHVSRDMIGEGADLIKLYHTMIAKLFVFIKNHDHITNVTREPRLDLWGTTPACYDRAIIRNVSCSTRTERILIRQLWTLAETYRGDCEDIIKDRDLMQQIAANLAEQTDLTRWLLHKRNTWGDKSNYK